MANILIGTVPVVGHINPLLAIARVLVARGHAVRWLTSATFSGPIEATGARFVPMSDGDKFEIGTFEARFPERARLRGLAQLKFDIKHGFMDAAPVQLRDVERIMHEFPADAVLGDTVFVGGQLYHELHGVPYATAGIVPLTMPSRDTAPFGFGLAPSSSPLGRARNRALNMLVERVLFRDVHLYYNKLRAGIGLPPLTRFFMKPQPSTFLYMQATVPGFEYPRSDAPEQLHFIGPVLPEPPQSWTAPAWWHELDTAATVVCVTQGTVATDPGQLIVPTIKALGGQDVLLVVATGGRTAAELPIDRLPLNVRVEPFIPFAHLLPHVDVMVTNGGYGGVQTALAAGVPLVVAGDSEDKPEVACRVAWSGAGINLRTPTPSPGKVAAAVQAVRTVPRYRANAERLRDEFARYDGPQRAAALLERLIATGRPVPRDADISVDRLPALASPAG